MTEEDKYLVEECKQKKEWEERYRSNYIEFDDYFKYSGEVEPTRVLITRYKYNYNTNCNDLCSHYIKNEDYEKLWEKWKFEDFLIKKYGMRKIRKFSFSVFAARASASHQPLLDLMSSNGRPEFKASEFASLR